MLLRLQEHLTLIDNTTTRPFFLTGNCTLLTSTKFGSKLNQKHELQAKMLLIYITDYSTYNLLITEIILRMVFSVKIEAILTYN